MPDLVPANAPPASYADFTAAQRSLYGAGMLPKLNIAIGSQLPGGAQEAANGAALSALPNMPPPATLPPTTPRGGGGRAVGGNFLSALFGGVGGSGLGHQVPPAHPVAPVAPVSTATMSGGFTPAPRPADTIAPPTLGGEPAQSGGYTPPGAAAPNQIRGGLLPPPPLPPHPADYATWYAGKLAENMQAGAEAGPQGGQGIHFIGPNSPPMEAPAHPAAVNVIRGGIQSGGGGDAGGGGMNLMQFEAVKPLVEARMQAQQLNPAMTIPNELMAMAKYRRDQRIAGKEDPTKVMADYEGELYRIHNQTLALIQALSQH